MLKNVIPLPALVTMALLLGCPPDQRARPLPSDQTTSGSGDSGAGAPDPTAVVRAMGKGLCELSADCPAGAHCDLGECIQRCESSGACAAGSLCSARGLCAADEHTSSDPALTTTATVAVQAEAPSARVGVDATETVVEFKASTSEVVQYRVEPRASWLKCLDADRGSFQGALRVRLSVDRSAAPVGETVGQVLLRTNHGDVPVSVVLESTLTGVYKGQLGYEQPRALGRVPMTLEIVERGAGVVDVRVRSSESPTIPLAGRTDPAFSGRFENGKLEGRLYQRISPASLGGGARTALTSDVGRILTLSLTRSATGFSGTFEERWIAVLPVEQRFSGNVHLLQVPNEQPGMFAVDQTPVLPAPHTEPAPVIPVSCAVATGCSADPGGSEAMTCGQRALAAGAKDISGASLVALASQGQGARTYKELADLCVSEWNDRPPAAASSLCVHPAMLDCAFALFTRGVLRGDSNGDSGLFDVAAARAGVGLLVANEAVAQAYRVPYESPDGVVESKVSDLLDKAHRFTVDTLRSTLQPFFTQSAYDASNGSASRGDYAAVRRMAHLLGREREVAEEELALMRRRTTASLEQVRELVRVEAMNLLLGAVVVHSLAEKHKAPPSRELSMLNNNLTGVAAQGVDLEQVDPLGYPRGYVPFVYGAQQAGPLKASNLDFLLADAEESVQKAVELEKEADAVYQSYKETAESLDTDLTELKLSSSTKLAEICGHKSGTNEADVAGCARGNGMLGQAIIAHKMARTGVQIAAARIEELHQRIEIQTQRLTQVNGIQAELIAFVGESNTRINALEASKAKLQLARRFMSNISFANIYAFAASTFTAGADMALGTAENSFDAQVRQLQQAQQWKTLEANREQDYVNGMAVIKELLIGETQLLLELQRENDNAALAALSIQRLEDERTALQIDEQIRRSLTLDSLRNNPLLRVLKEQKVRRAMLAREVALRRVYLAALAFQFEVNTTLPGIREKLVPSLRAEHIADFLYCIRTSRADYAESFSAGDLRADELSLRRDVLGIRAARTDEVTGEVLSEAEQFRRLFLRPSHMSDAGTLSLTFSTSLSSGNGLWSTGLCNDQVASIDVKLIGDRLGDQQATVRLRQAGTAIQRSCEAFRQGAGEILRTYDIAKEAIAEVQAGVNSYSMRPNSELFGRSVAATVWELSIPSASQAPRNADLNLESLEDIVIRVEHSARTLVDSRTTYNPICL